MEEDDIAPMTPSDEMLEFFYDRTHRHIALVGKYCERILNHDGLYHGIMDLAEVHDASKFCYPELDPYVWLTWKYKIQAEGMELAVPMGMAEKMNAVTEHHIKCNMHHPDYFDMAPARLNQDNRDEPPDTIVDATRMPVLYVAEMVADWCAVSEERGNTPMDWIDKNVGIRWKFDINQTGRIKDLTHAIWEE